MSWQRSLSAVLPGPLWDVKKRYLVTQSSLDCIWQLVSAACVTTPQPPPLCTDFVQFSGGVTYSPLLQEQLSDDMRWEKPSDGCRRQLVRAPWGCCQQEQLKGTTSIGENVLWELHPESLPSTSSPGTVQLSTNLERMHFSLVPPSLCRLCTSHLRENVVGYSLQLPT